MRKMRYAAVIAAAGLSSRMHEFKPMVVIGESTMIEHVINNLKSAGVEQIVVVTGYKADLLTKHVSGLGVKIVHNRAYASTKMYDSVVAGLKALDPVYDAVFITPGDVPLVRPETIRKMEECGDDIVRPMCGNEIGHPILIKEELVQEMIYYKGEGGLRGVISSLGRKITDIPVDDMGIMMEADTKEDLKALNKKSMSDRSGGSLWPDICINLSKSEIVLSPERAQFLEMIEQMGSIQNACASVHMSYSKGWRMLNGMEEELGYRLVERTTGGASGGGTRLSREGDELLRKYKQFTKEVREKAEEVFAQLFNE